MVLFAPLVGAAVFLSGFTAALPTSYGSSSSDSSDYGSSGSSSSSYGSSDSSSGYGSSGYGSSGSSYGSSSSDSSDSSNYGDSSYGDSSSMMMEDSSTMMMDSSSMMMDSTETIDSTSTTTGYNSYQTSNYGSGSSYWGGSGYEDCVNQCVAQYGGGMGGTYQATQTAGYGGYSGSSGNSGVTHTIVVAPSEGVLRMMPFMTNASVGDVVEFHWGANEHTVTKSSELLPCNKSSEAPVFASGEQNAGFIFTQLVNDTDPIFFYCGTPGHCEKGMFGVINPAMTTPGTPNSLGGMMSSMAANDSDLSAYAAYTMNATSNNEGASQWGMNLDMSGWPEWSHSLVAENVMFGQSLIAQNPWVMSNGTMSLSQVGTKSLNMPIDPAAFNAADSGSAAPVSATPGPVSADATSAPAAPPASSSSSSGSSGSSNTSGANSVASPRFLVAAVVVVATIFAL